MAALTLHEYTNRGRLFDVKPTFADIVGHEMVLIARDVAADLNRQAFGGPDDLVIPYGVKRLDEQYGPRFFPVDQSRLFEYRQCQADTEELICNLQAGHAGPHYDSGSRIEWAQR